MEPSRRPKLGPGPARSSGARPVLATAVVAACGLALSVYATLASLRGEHELAVHAFKDLAHEQARAVEQRLALDIEVLESVRRLYGSSRLVEAHEFASFVRPSLANHPALQLLGWVPVDGEAGLDALRLSTAQTAQGTLPGAHYTATRPGADSHPLDTPGQRAACLQAMQRAWDSGRPAATWLPDAPETSELVVAQAIGTRRPAPGAPAGTGAGRRGFALAVVDVREALRQARRDLPDHARTGQLTLRPDAGQVPVETLEETADGLSLALPVPVADRTVLLEARASGDFLAAHGSELAWWLLGGGLLVTLLVAMTLNATLRRIDEVTRANRTVRRELVQRRRAERAQRRAREEAEAACRIKSNLLANMSHEIRTPLNGMLGLTELVLAEELPPELREPLLGVRTSAGSLLAIVDDILDIARIEHGRLGVEQLRFDVHECVRSAVELFRARALHQGLALELQVGPAVPRWLLGDATRLRQVLSGLLGNAFKFTRRGGVTVSLGGRRLDDGHVAIELAVTDTGAGIDPSLHERIFERFTQGDESSTRRHGGAGVGLYLCREVVRLMGGTIRVDSAPGMGTTFTVTLTLPVSETPEPPVASAPTPLAGSPHEGPPRVLLVEDNRINRLVAGKLLERLGCDVQAVTDGRQAVQALAAERYDLVFMDCQMPVLDGYEATRAIRAAEGPDGPHTPIVALTAHAMRGDRERCLEAGMDEYLSKPVGRDALAAMIVALLPWTADRVGV